MKIHLTLLAASLLLCAPAALAGSPTVSIIAPRGAQRGTQLELHIYGDRLADAEDILFYSPGLSLAAPLKVVTAKMLTAQLKLAPDCRLGEHALRIRTRSGLSELRTFWVGSLPELEESEPNEDGQPIAIPCTLNGRLRPEDVDRFKIQVKAGQPLNIEVLALRLATLHFDPVLRLKDLRGAILAESDDSALGHQDGHIGFIPKTDGELIIELHDNAWRGDNNAHYRLAIGSYPRPTLASPLGAAPGESLQVDLLGDIAGITSATITIPKDATELFEFIPESPLGAPASPIRMRVSSLPRIVEASEPNWDPAIAAKGPILNWPFALEGRIEQTGDIDFHRFQAKKDQNFLIEAFAWRLGSPLDPLVTIHDSKGRYLAGADDGRELDCAFEWRAPAEGEYLLRVADQRARGGPTFLYRVELGPRVPSIELNIPKVDRTGQRRQDIPVPAGSRNAVLVQVERRGIGGPLRAESLGLPTGLSMEAPELDPSERRLPIIITAAESAPRSGGIFSIFGKIKIDNKIKDNEILGRLQQHSDLIYGPPNDQLYWERVEDNVAWAVTEPLGFTLELDAPTTPLAQNGYANLNLRTTAPSTADLRLELLYDPQGLGSGRGAIIPKGKNHAPVPINAAPNARPGRWPIIVLGRLAAPSGEVQIATGIAWLEVIETPARLEFQRSVIDIGATGYATAQIAGGPRADAKVQLLGLPPDVSADTAVLASDATSLTIPIKVGPKARPGRYRGVLAEVRHVLPGGELIYRSPAFELRIDPPTPGKSTAANAPPPERPLSRLEQLRRDKAARIAEKTEATPDGGKK